MKDLLQGATFNGVTLTVALAALIVGGVAIYYGRSALFPPKRSITLSVLNSSPLLNHAPGLDSKVRVQKDGVDLVEPYVLTMRMVSSGRHSIPSANFDQGRPLRVSLGAKIMEVLDVVDNSPASPPPSWKAEGHDFLLGPDLITKGQVLDVTFLTEGEPKITFEHHIIDTKVRMSREDGPSIPQRILFTSVSASTAATIALLINLLTS